MQCSQHITFRELKTPVESRMMTRIARELQKQKEERKRQEEIPDADDSSHRYIPYNEQPRL